MANIVNPPIGTMCYRSSFPAVKSAQEWRQNMLSGFFIGWDRSGLPVDSIQGYQFLARNESDVDGIDSITRYTNESDRANGDLVSSLVCNAYWSL